MTKKHKTVFCCSVHKIKGAAWSSVFAYKPGKNLKTIAGRVWEQCPFYSVNWMQNFQIRSDQIGRSVGSDSLWPHELQHARPPCPTPIPEFTETHDHRVSDAISSSVLLFSSCLQSLPASESFPVSQPFTWGGQSTGVSALASFLPKKSQGWSPLEWTGWISFQSKRLSRVFSNTSVQKHQFFGAQPSSQSNSHIHTWPQEKP